ncbi:MAG: universal stress protein [Desulfosarcinaceae bacterium]|nr:universal stress protein [Desulfosarcinaceae bacterium]
MATLKILVPYNFTGNDEKAIDFVIDRYGRSAEAEITLFHTHAPLPNVDIPDKTVMTRLSANLSYLRQRLSEREQALVAAAERLVAAGFPEDNVDWIFKPRQREPALEIIEQAQKHRYSTIILNHHPSKVRKFFTASISKKVAQALRGMELHIVG